MKLIYYEIKKVLSKRIFLSALIFCVVINLTTFYFTNSSNYTENLIIRHKSEFVTMVDKYSSMPQKEARKLLQKQDEAFTIAEQINSVTNNLDADLIESEIAELEEYKKNSPDVYALAEEMLTNGEYADYKHWFVSMLLSQLDYIDSYPDFIGEMGERANAQASFAVFGEQNGFSYKNIYKTADDYQHMADTELTIGNDYPLMTVFSYQVTDCFLILLVFLLCFYIFRYEREKGFYNLVRTSRNGKLKTISAKLCAMLVITAVVTTVMVFLTLVMSTVLFGQWEFSRPIQSIAEMRNCIYPLSCDSFCLLFMSGKVLAMMFIAVIFAVVYISVSNSTLTHIVSFGIIGVELFLYTVIPNYAFINQPKYINIFYFLDAGQLFGHYLNLNIFGIPLKADAVVFVVFDVLFVTGLLTSILMFTYKSQEVKSGTLVSKLSAIMQKHSKIAGSTAVLNGEFYKYFISGKGALILFVILIFSVASSIGIVQYSVTEPADVAYQQYIAMLEGELTETTATRIKEYRQYFSKLENRKAEISSNEKTSQETKNFAIQSIENILNTRGAGFARVDEQYKRMLKLQEQGVKAQLLDEFVYPSFVANSEREWNHLAIHLLLMLLTIPLIYTFEYRKNMIDLLQATRHGRAKLFYGKLTVAVLSAAFTFTAVYLPYFIRFVSTFGTKRLGAPIICFQKFENADSQISLLGAFIMGTLCYFTIALVGVAIMILVSVYVKNYMLSTVLSAVIMFVPCLVIYSFPLIRVGTVFGENCIPKLFVTLLLSLVSAVILTISSAVKCTGKKIKPKVV